MDKDLAAAVMLERCACYDRSLDSARKVLEKKSVDSDEAFWARKIVKSLGEAFLKQRFVDKAMECYRLIVRYAPDPEVCAEGSESTTFADLGPNVIPVSTKVSRDVHEMLTSLRSIAENRDKSEPDLVREGIYLLILKYATDSKLRELIMEKMENVLNE